VDGRVLLSHGGTESIESPAQYSAVARRLLSDLGIDLQRFYTAFDRKRYSDLRLSRGIFYDQETFGSDQLVKGDPVAGLRAMVAQAPLSERAKRDLLRLHKGNQNYLPGLSSAQAKARLAKTSYKAYLLDVVQVDPQVAALFQTRTHELYGVGIDAIPALDCWGLDLPGFEGLHLDAGAPSPGIGRTPLLEMHEEEPYIFHFPDGNATISRLLVRSLIPGSLPGGTASDSITAKLDYARLDGDAAPVRIRLSSTVVRVTHTGEPGTAREVAVTYVRGGKMTTVRAGACVLACWNMVIPYLCTELPAAQKKALSYGVKVPIVYANAALRNWEAFRKAGVSDILAPGSWYSRAFLDFPVDLGDYHSSRTPDQPVVLKLVRAPCHPGVASRDQHRIGRAELLATPFATFEEKLKDLLGRALGPYGFDPAADLAALTVNRWSHGYSYEYNSLWDGPWAAGEEPCVAGRQRFGRIVIANADAEAYAYTNAAIDQAWRAVAELGETASGAAEGRR
jgi:spermidine dehydrogenase